MKQNFQLFLNIENVHILGRFHKTTGGPHWMKIWFLHCILFHSKDPPFLNEMTYNSQKKFHYMRPPLWFFGVLTKCAYFLCWKKIKRILLENNFLGVYLNEIRYNSQELFPILYPYNLYHWYFFVLSESWIVVCLGVNWKMVFISSPINFKFLNSE